MIIFVGLILLGYFGGLSCSSGTGANGTKGTSGSPCAWDQSNWDDCTWDN